MGTKNKNVAGGILEKIKMKGGQSAKFSIPPPQDLQRNPPRFAMFMSSMPPEVFKNDMY